MHGNTGDASEQSKDAVLSFHSVFEIEVLVPEWMRQKIEANALRASLEKSRQ